MRQHKKLRMKKMMNNKEIGNMIRKKETMIETEIEIERKIVKEIILQDVLHRHHRNLLNLLHHRVNQEEGELNTVIGGRLLEENTITVNIIINVVVIIQNQDQNQRLLNRKLTRKNRLRIQLNIGIKLELTWVSICCEG